MESTEARRQRQLHDALVEFRHGNQNLVRLVFSAAWELQQAMIATEANTWTPDARAAQMRGLLHHKCRAVGVDCPEVVLMAVVRIVGGK